MGKSLSLQALYAIERRHDLWEKFRVARARLSREAWDEVSVGCDSGPIAKTGVVWQPLSRQWAERLVAVVESSPSALVERGDYIDGYFATLEANILNYLNVVNDYRAVTPALTTALREFLTECGPQITQLVAHPWRVCSVRQFNLRSTTEIGSRHVDGWPPAMRKIFILPGGASAKTGTTWFRLRDGTEMLFDHPAPCWVMFENNVVLHAISPGTGNRSTIELDLVPSRETSLEPLYAGINGWYPWFPDNSARWHLTAAMQSLRVIALDART